jgi:hypothetical protein
VRERAQLVVERSARLLTRAALNALIYLQLISVKHRHTAATVRERAVQFTIDDSRLTIENALILAACGSQKGLQCSDAAHVMVEEVFAGS